MLLKLPYYGQRDREVILDRGDLFKFVLINGRIDIGVFLDFMPDSIVGAPAALRVLTEKGAEEIKITMFFRLERLEPLP